MITLPKPGQALQIKDQISLAWAEFFRSVYTACFSVYQSGTTAQRPTKELWKGRQFFDTDLGYTITYNSGWNAYSLKSVTDSITAGTTQTQAGATALTSGINRVTVSGTNGDGVKLPSAVLGMEIKIVNDDSAQTIQIWPNTSDSIDGGAADAVDGNTLAAGASRTYFTTDSTNWYTG